MLRQSLLSSRAPRPLDLPGIGRAWLRVPTALDAVESDGKGVGWYLVRFICNEDCSPVFREDEQAEALRMPGWAATRVVEEVGRLMQAPHDSGEAAAAPPRLETRNDGGGDPGDAC